MNQCEQVWNSLVENVDTKNEKQYDTTSPYNRYHAPSEKKFCAGWYQATNQKSILLLKVSKSYKPVSRQHECKQVRTPGLFSVVQQLQTLCRDHRPHLLLFLRMEPIQPR